MPRLFRAEWSVAAWSPVAGAGAVACRQLGRLPFTRSATAAEGLEVGEQVFISLAAPGRVARVWPAWAHAAVAPDVLAAWRAGQAPPALAPQSVRTAALLSRFPAGSELRIVDGSSNGLVLEAFEAWPDEYAPEGYRESVYGTFTFEEVSYRDRALPREGRLRLANGLERLALARDGALPPDRIAVVISGFTHETRETAGEAARVVAKTVRWRSATAR